MSDLFRRLASWRRRRVTEDELRDELEFHLAEEAAERQEDGVSPEYARRRAHLDLGNTVLIREDVRTLWTWTTLEQIVQDARYALRTMVRYRLVMGLAMASLALGIGANTAIYSFMDALVFRALPVPQPESLAAVTWRAKPYRNAPRENVSQFVLRGINGSTYRDTSGVTASILPFPAFERLHEVSGSVFSALFAYRSAGRLNVIVGGEAEVATGEYVTGGFFSGLQVVPIAGRALVADDDRVGAPPAVVLSNGYSARRFGSGGAAIGQTVLINNVAFTVIGVAPEGFSGTDPATIPDIYLPLHSVLALDMEPPERFHDQNYYWLNLMGRLRPGVRLADAQAVLATPFEQWVRSTATTSAELANLPVLQLTSGAGGLDTLRRGFSRPVYVLLVMVGLILAIACANTANLLLARSTARRREIAVRLAIGAGRLRIIRQLLTESVVLAVVSGALGVLVAIVSIETLSQLLANGQEANGQLVAVIDARLDWRVLSVTAVLSIASGLLFGLVPALQSTKPSLIPALKDASVADPYRRVRLWPRMTVMQSLIVSQLVMSLLLLVAAGLFARTLTNLQSIELGFDPDHLLLFDVNAAQTGRTMSETAAFYADLRQRLSEAPGVRDATLAHASIIAAGRGLAIEVVGTPATASRILNAGPAFLKTMGIRVLRGRDLEDRDGPGGTPAVVISDAFARTYFPGRDPIGHRIHLARPTPVDFEIVGIAAEAHYGGLKRDVPPVVYMPYGQTPFPPLGQMTFVVRTDADPLRHASIVRDIVRRADSRVPVMRIRTQVGEIEQTLNQEIIFARLCTAFAILAMVMACIGLYGTMAYGVTRRSPEIGIRIALGAPTGTVIWMVLREVCVLAAVGLMLSIPIALSASRLVQSFLFEVKPNDPFTIVSAVGVLVLAALLAGWGPARRAARISPAIALRAD
jgi:predicted permease